MRLVLSLIGLLFSLFTAGQPFPVGKRTITFVDGGRSGRNISTELYYPGAMAGNNAPLAAGTEKYPVVVFGHGFLMSPAAYGWLADSLVKYGFIVAFPSTESGVSPSHEQFGRDLGFLAQRIPSLNDSTDHFLYGRVANKSAIGGHSMGGGASFLAMNYNTQVQAVFNFAAAETNPSAKAAASTIQKPTLIFSGTQDCIVAPAEQQIMYNNVPYSCKTYVNITGGLHCHFGNNDATCVFGQVTSGCNASSISASVLFSKVIALLRPFLLHYLKADCVAANTFESSLATVSGINVLRNCSSDPLGCVITAAPNVIQTSILNIYPNPAVLGSNTQLKLERGVFQQLTCYDLSGRVIFRTRTPRSPVLSINVPSTGLHIVQAETSVGIFYRTIVFHK
jgi:dienelactone hydrolase